MKVPNPQFEGQTKTKLGNSEVRGIVDTITGEAVSIYLEEHPTEAKRIVDKSVKAARAREAAQQGARDDAPQKCAGKHEPAREAGGLLGERSGVQRAVHCRGEFRRWLGG